MVYIKEECEMPEISLFYGIRITMYYEDHNPPHFHAEYNGNKAGESIYGTKAGSVAMGDSIVSTQSNDGKCLYIHLLKTQTSATSITLPMEVHRFKRVTTLMNSEAVTYKYDKKRKQTTFYLPKRKENELTDFIIKLNK